MELGLRGRTAIVCGGSAGIGLGCAEALAEAGANLVLFARGRETLEREASRLDGLVTDLLEYTRPAPLRRVPTELAALVYEALRVFANDPTASRVRVEQNLAPVTVQFGSVAAPVVSFTATQINT